MLRTVCLLDSLLSLCHWASTSESLPTPGFAPKDFAASQLQGGLDLTPTGLAPASLVQLSWTHPHPTYSFRLPPSHARVRQRTLFSTRKLGLSACLTVCETLLLVF